MRSDSTLTESALLGGNGYGSMKLCIRIHELKVKIRIHSGPLVRYYTFMFYFFSNIFSLLLETMGISTRHSLKTDEAIGFLLYFKVPQNLLQVHTQPPISNFCLSHVLYFIHRNALPLSLIFMLLVGEFLCLIDESSL